MCIRDRIKTFIDGLRNGNDELNLVRLNDVDFQNKMQELDDKFSDLYKKIYLVKMCIRDRCLHRI